MFTVGSRLSETDSKIRKGGLQTEPSPDPFLTILHSGNNGL